MSKANFVIEGFAAEPKQRVSQSGKQMLDISVAHSPRKFNKQTNQWEDATDRDGNKVTLWARATFFDDMAAFLATQVTKGTLVRLEGEPRLNVYEDGGGRPAANIEIQFASLAVVPLKPRQDAGHGGFNAGSGAGMNGWAQPGANGTQNGFQDSSGFDEQQPF